MRFIAMSQELYDRLFHNIGVVPVGFVDVTEEIQALRTAANTCDFGKANDRALKALAATLAEEGLTG